jgi:hypothetical protein
MDAALLGKLLGKESQWHGPCTIIIDAAAAIQTLGTDSIVASAAKIYAPRLVSGRILADSVQLLPDESALLILQQQKIRQGPAEEIVKQTLTVVEPKYVVAVEFLNTAPLTNLGISPPPSRSGSHPGTFMRPS